LREWGIAVRQVGAEVASLSVTDENILPALHRLKHPTFFTRESYDKVLRAAVDSWTVHGD